MATTMHVSDVAELLSEGRTHFNLSPAALVEHSIRRNEAKLASNGALVGYTNRTGRSPKDKFVVKDETTAHTVAWGAVNAPYEPEKFDALYARVMEHLRGRELFVQDLFCGADPAYRLPVRVWREHQVTAELPESIGPAGGVQDETERARRTEPILADPCATPAEDGCSTGFLSGSPRFSPWKIPP